jgi:hypothetical protein
MHIHPHAGSIQIRVKDEGVGLEKDQLALIFSSEGIQFNANQLQHGGGSGLGLAIAFGVVDQHGGIITAESDGRGQGSTLIVELPLYEYPIEEAKQQEDDKESTTNTAALSTSGIVTAGSSTISVETYFGCRRFRFKSQNVGPSI